MIIYWLWWQPHKKKQQQQRKQEKHHHQQNNNKKRRTTIKIHAIDKIVFAIQQFASKKKKRRKKRKESIEEENLNFLVISNLSLSSSLRSTKIFHQTFILFISFFKKKASIPHKNKISFLNNQKIDYLEYIYHLYIYISLISGGEAGGGSRLSRAQFVDLVVKVCVCVELSWSRTRMIIMMMPSLKRTKKKEQIGLCAPSRPQIIVT